MTVFRILIGLAVVLAPPAGPAAFAAVTGLAAPAASAPALAEPPRGSPGSQFNADGSLRPPLDKATTAKLNAIVRRAKNAIESFDARLAKTVDSLEAGRALPPGSPDRAAIAAEVAALHTIAAAAKADVAAEEPILEASGRYYSKIVFAGMVKFTRDVEAELREHMEKLGTAKPPN